MALPKKGSRKIEINGERYLWIAKGNSGYINLIITSASFKNGQKLLATFDYDAEDEGASAFVRPFIITPYVVREVILYALEHGYIPNENKKELNLGNLSKKIKLNRPTSETKSLELPKELINQLTQLKESPNQSRIDHVLILNKIYLNYSFEFPKIKPIIDFYCNWVEDLPSLKDKPTWNEERFNEKRKSFTERHAELVKIINEILTEEC